MNELMTYSRDSFTIDLSWDLLSQTQVVHTRRNRAVNGCREEERGEGREEEGKEEGNKKIVR